MEQDSGASASQTGLSPSVEPASGLAGSAASIPSAEDFNTVWANQPPSPTRDRPIEVCVVAKRCVYVNNHRVAGGKPWVTENLPQHVIMTKLGDVLDAFTAKEIRAALREKKRSAEYFSEYHRRKKDASAMSASGQDPQGLEAKPASAVAKPDAQGPSHD